MGRRKQARPHRSSGSIVEKNHVAASAELDQHTDSPPPPPPQEKEDVDTPYHVQLDSSKWLSAQHLDVSELVLTGLNFGDAYAGFTIGHDFYKHSNNHSLRFRVSNVDGLLLDRIKLGHWPVLSSTSVSLELIEVREAEDGAEKQVILSGTFDGPDEGVTALVHLASIGFLTVRPLPGDKCVPELMSLRVRVEMLRTAFDACQSLLDNTRHLWKRSMMNVMAWLRPEVTTSETRYGVSKSSEIQVSLVAERAYDTSKSRKQARFDASVFYEAIKPSKSDPMLEHELPDLLPVLRPYQRRAVYWMLKREKGDLEGSGVSENQFCSPLCIPVEFLDTGSKMFYNPFSGNISLHPHSPSAYVVGGILADEMGLGKTIELLACIFAHRKPDSKSAAFVDAAWQDTSVKKVDLKRLKRERVECICGAVSESNKYKGLWVQCDICDAWQHADCVGYSPKGKKKRSVTELQKNRKKTKITLVERDGDHICQMCSELIQATDSPIVTAATLIVCPAPILHQWHAEIMRHTRPGSLKTFIYEGIRDSSLLHTSVVDISELVGADIVLTTYDVLKEDLSHDCDRHDGDRHVLRFQKRYPVIPTPLTRIFWWRICLDEAQMVESNTAAATEMALRLSAQNHWCISGTPIQRKLDDLYGLLRFLKASPFNVSRWWIDVIRDPYERRDPGAVEFTHKFFKPIMWRSSKIHVADELQLPPQEECISWLNLSAIEEYFYRRQHETCVSHAREVIESLKVDILNRKVPGSAASSDASTDPFISHADAAKLLNSLLKLRQACCHPQVGSSGLRSLQQSPMTMEEILMVLVGKTKIEGEEALRKLVVALNALAAIAIIKKDHCEAVSLYKEALVLTQEHSEDFRLDPLLNIHIHYNLAEILPMVINCSLEPPSNGQEFYGNSETASKIHSIDKCDINAMKRRKVSGKDNSYFTFDAVNLPNLSETFVHGDRLGYANGDALIEPFSDESLRMECENLKQRYLSVFASKLSLAQQDFRKSYMQVCNTDGDANNQNTAWWLDALHYAEQNKDLSGELIRKIEYSISSNSRSSRIASRFWSITALKYHIQTRLDQLKASRKTLIDRLLEIDQTMEKPKEQDIERVRYCRICQAIEDGLTCVHCELDQLFTDYEARLFRLSKSRGEVITSAEEAVDLQKKNSALNRFYMKLSQPEKSLASSSNVDEESKKRDLAERVTVSKLPSELEVILGVIKNQCKAQLGREGLSAASTQLHLLDSMRKEYSHARSLAVAQAQVLRAHDEIKMATSRLHLRENENDKSIDALGADELEPASVLQSNEKFISLAMLNRIKGKLRYLKGLVLSKQQSPSESPKNSFLHQEMPVAAVSKEKSICISKDVEDACPVCQEKLTNQRMVFQCGHLTCCKCLFAMTEQNANKFRRQWLKCPTCRQHTEFGSIAYADDRQDKSLDSVIQHTVQDGDKCEASLTVQGSYGTKIEAVTRRILWIKSSDPKAKVLVFSSWNDVLDVLEHAFKANNITYIRMKGGRKSHVAISEFRGQKSGEKRIPKMQAQGQEHVQVLLLLIQHGANGLNLLEAQHVVLMEPLLNPAAEAQAISRVHRIGQENRTLVHRFIVKDSVEESIHKLNRSRNTNSFISGNTKNQDQPLLTLKDLESLFAMVSVGVGENDGGPSESLRHLPPSMAAAIATERRLKESA